MKPSRPPVLLPVPELVPLLPGQAWGQWQFRLLATSPPVHCPDPTNRRLLLHHLRALPLHH